MAEEKRETYEKVSSQDEEGRRERESAGAQPGKRAGDSSRTGGSSREAGKGSARDVPDGGMASSAPGAGKAQPTEGDDAPWSSPTTCVGLWLFNALALPFTALAPKPEGSSSGSGNHGGDGAAGAAEEAALSPAVGAALAWGLLAQVFLVWLLLAWSEKAGCLLGVSPLITGATVSASACAAPTYLASRSLAQNKGDLGGAIANALGSNVFSLLVAVGLPWLLEVLLLQQGRPVAAGAVEDTAFALLVILGCLIALGGSLAARRLRQTASDGHLYLGFYALGLMLLVLHDYRLVGWVVFSLL